MKKFLVGLAVVGLLITGQAQSIAIENDVRVTPLSPAAIRTDNQELNDKIAKGEVTVGLYHEPSDRRKQEIDRQLRSMGYSTADIEAMPWPQKETLILNSLSKAKTNWNSEVGATWLDTDGSLEDWNTFNEDISTSSELRIRMWAFWEWGDLPVWKLKDKIAWAWAADHTFGVNGSSSVVNKEYYYGCYYRNSSDCMTLQVTSNLLRDGVPNVGQATEIDIVGMFDYGGKSYSVYDMYGNSRLVIRRGRAGTGDGGTLASLTKYFHAEYECEDLTVGFSGSGGDNGGVSISAECQLVGTYSETSDTHGLNTIDYHN